MVLCLPVFREGVVEFLIDCQDGESGGFRPVQGHDPHLLNTLSAVQVDLFCRTVKTPGDHFNQVAAIYSCLDRIDTDGVVR